MCFGIYKTDGCHRQRQWYVQGWMYRRRWSPQVPTPGAFTHSAHENQAYDTPFGVRTSIALENLIIETGATNPEAHLQQAVHQSKVMGNTKDLHKDVNFDCTEKDTDERKLMRLEREDHFHCRGKRTYDECSRQESAAHETKDTYSCRYRLCSCRSEYVKLLEGSSRLSVQERLGKTR